MTSITPASLGAGRRGTRLPDRAFRSGTRILGWLVVAILILIGALLAANGRLAFETFGPGFISGTTWDPVKNIYGALPYILGTLFSAAIALVIAGPIGILTALYLAELAPRRVAIPLTFMIELLAAIPSVVFGLWGVFVLSPFLRTTIEAWIVDRFGWIPIFAGPSFGIGLFAAGVILAIMIIPTTSSVSREALLAVPQSQREAALSLGATRWETTRLAVLRYARAGIFGAIILGLGRAVGETMAVTMTIGNRNATSVSLFDQGQTIASWIANNFTEANGPLELSALIELGLVLMLMSLVINAFARLMVGRVLRRGEGAA